MYAIIATGGKQYKVSEGDIITVEKLAVEAGSEYKFDKVLVLAKEGDIKVGAPYVGTAVTGTVVENGKGQKVIIFKYKAKKDYRKKQGHRQPYTMVKIASLTGAAPKQEAPKAEEVHAEPAKEEAKAAKCPLPFFVLFSFLISSIPLLINYTDLFSNLSSSTRSAAPKKRRQTARYP